MFILEPAPLKGFLLSSLALASLLQPILAIPSLTPRATVPNPPADPPQAAGDGSGAWNAESCGFNDYKVDAILRGGVGVFNVKGYHQAARALDHYLDNKGSDLSIDVDEMMKTTPAFKDKVHALAESLVKQKVAGFIGPWITMTFASDWQVWHAWNDATNEPFSYDWYYAMGEYVYAVTGVATHEHDGSITLQWKGHVFDRYNWDQQGKSSHFGPITLSHKEMGHLHKCGMAREYTMRGTGKEQVVHGYDSKKGLPAISL